MSAQIVYRNGRKYMQRADGTLEDIITGAAIGFGLDAVLGDGDNLDGAIIGGLLGGVGGGLMGGLIGGLLDD